MKICHIIGSLDPAGGGPPQVAARISAAQAHAGHEVTLAAYDRPDRREAVRAMLEKVPFRDGVRMHELPPPAGVIDRVLARGVGPVLGRIVQEVDVIHCHGVWDPLVLAATRHARRHGRPYVIRPAGMLDPWSLSQKRWKKRLAMAVVYRRMLNGALFLHALNADEADLVGPLQLRCPVRVVPNGVFLEELRPLPELGAFRREHPAVGDRPFVLFLSRLHYKKGLDYLADAFAQVAGQVPDCHLVVAGPDEGAQGEFERRIAHHGLQARVHLVGPIYGQQKYSAMVDATCFCLPSRQEGFSVAITEALACGTPVVISRDCHFPEVATAGAGRVVPLSAEAVAEALREVLTQPAARQAMGAAGRELVETQFTWPRIAERLVELYQDAPGA